MRVYGLGIIFLWVVNMIDVFYTRSLMTAGIASEANPLMDWVITNYGFGGLGVFKTFWIVMLWALILIMYKKYGGLSDLIKALYWGTILAYTVLTGYHFFIQASL